MAGSSGISGEVVLCIISGIVFLLALIHISSINKIEQESNEKAKNLANNIIRNKIHEVILQKDKALSEINDAKLKLDKSRKELKKQEEIFNKLYEEKTKGLPWIAEQYGIFKSAYLEAMETHLKSKKNPAIKASEAVKTAKNIAKEAERKYFIAQGLIDFYESVVPWLPDLQEAPDEAITNNSLLSEVENNYDRAREYLSNDEWNSLPNQKKFQYALDRYWGRDKTKWEIGRLYERFIGYEYEQRGWDITYFGAIKGYEDLGRDLIAKKCGDTRIIQCKNWSAEKLIHEKHIFQLYGTCILYELENDKNPQCVKGIFVSSCQLSDIAKSCALRLGIEVIENKKLERFPCIKCVNRNDESIYHLPFDQQYDKIKMQTKKGDFYCDTVADAEKQGFRRAYRWRGKS